LQSTLKGEAVAVDLPDGQTLFALLSSPGQHSTSDYHDQLFNDALLAGAVSMPPMPRRYDSSEWAEMRSVAARLKPSLTLPLALYPRLVWFRDIRDPESVEAIEADMLSATFGPGNTIKRITLTVTDQVVTTGINKRLGWLQKLQHQEGMLNGDRFEDFRKSALAGHISPFDFTTERLK